MPRASQSQQHERLEVELDALLTQSAAYDLIESAVAICDGHGALRYQNPAFARFNSSIRDTAENFRIYGMLTECPEFLVWILSVISTATAGIFKRTFYYSPLITITLNVCGRPLTASSGAIDGVMLTLGEESIEFEHRHFAQLQEKNRTLSARIKILDREKQISEQLVRLLMKNAPFGIMIMDANRRVVQINTAAENLFGVSAASVIGQFCDRFLPCYGECGCCPVLELNRHIEAEEIQGVAANQVLPMLRSVATIKNGSEIMVVEAFVDLREHKRIVEEREQLRSQLQQAQKMEAIGQLTGGIAHDFNNILASILGYTDLALERFVPDKESKLASYLREVQTAGERARDLIAKMLAFSRGSKGESIYLDSAPLVKEVVKTLHAVIPTSIRLDAYVDDGLPPIFCDPIQFHQVLMNLAINARDAIGEHGQITIGLHLTEHVENICSSCHQNFSGDYVEVSVTDTGHGVPPEIVSRIFNPFFTTKEVGKGTGMGLSMVHGIVHDRAGHVLVESQSGNGSTFRLLFPVAHQENVEPATSGDMLKISNASYAAYILVVDDEPTVGRLLGEVLESYGYRVTVLSNSTQALAVFEQNPGRWDIVISDQTMPNLSGVDLTRKMLAIRPDLPIFLCTGYSNSIDEKGAKALGIRNYFQKPVSTPVLLNALSIVLNELKKSSAGG